MEGAGGSSHSQIAPHVTAFVDVLKALSSAEFSTCSLISIQSTFKWAELISSLSTMHGSDAVLQACVDVLSAAQGIPITISAKAIVYTPVETVLQLILESPIEQTQMTGGQVYRESFKLACASLGPERTVAFVSQVLRPKVCRTIYLKHYHLVEDDADIDTVNGSLSFLLLQALHTSRSISEERLAESLQTVQDIVSTDKVSLQQLCACLLFSESDIYLHMNDNYATGAHVMCELIDICRSEIFWAVAASVVDSDILFFLDSVSSDTVIKMCKMFPHLIDNLENRLLEVGENAIKRLAQGYSGGNF